MRPPPRWSATAPGPVTGEERTRYLGVWRDELDVEYVRLYSLIKP
ncbi:MAG: hypothetical protein WEF86_02350 [Gemmatimonadota bacterium]